MVPPEWALLERAVLEANAAACREFFATYFDSQGFLRCVERWGADDGPDDAIESCHHWPLLHALGAADDVYEMCRMAWEGHLRQYTQAKTIDVPMARNGMYYKEFPCMFDWQHNNEGLLVFHLLGLSDPDHLRYGKRLLRYAGFYLNEDPQAPNYDKQHRVIRSLFNGSRGPLLRKATALDWAGDPIEVEHRFVLRHGERNYREMLAHFEDYTDIVGDHPLNLLSTSLALNAYMLTGEDKYRRWVIDYVDAWHDRMIANGDIIPTNIGLDGTIGGACGGKWYGGTYGWGFTVTVPQSGEAAHRNRAHWGFTGFMNAYLLTGDDRYLDVWRKQRETVNSHARIIDGQKMYPHMYGDDGWYAFTPHKYGRNNLEIWYLSMAAEDYAHVSPNGWLDYLTGANPTFPEDALRADLGRIRQRVAAMRNDPTSPDTRLSDDPMVFNPASVSALRKLMLGGIDCGKKGSVLHCRVRYFDPVARRAGVPPDVAALVQRLTDDKVTLTLVNTNQTEDRTVIVQAGGYGEHQFTSASVDGRTIAIDASYVTVRLTPGGGGRMTFLIDRYVNSPRLAMPW